VASPECGTRGHKTTLSHIKTTKNNTTNEVQFMQPRLNTELPQLLSKNINVFREATTQTAVRLSSQVTEISRSTGTVHTSAKARLTISRYGSPPKFNHLFIGPLPTFPENFMQIHWGDFLHKVAKAPFTRYKLLSYRFHNRVNVCIHDTTGCQTGLTTGCIVYTNIQPVVKPV